jgi:GNAT superfamily N-acetyltransferase
MNGELTIRLLEERDIAVLTHTFRFSRHHIEGRRRERAAGLRTMFIAEQDGATIGCVAFEERMDRPGLLHFYALSVLPEHQSRGIGTRIVEAVEEEAQRRALGGVDLAVNIENEGAIRLYERLGYAREPGTVTNRWTWEGPNGEERDMVEECYRMVKRLARSQHGGVDSVTNPIFGP